jgi:hypothetical protein
MVTKNAVPANGANRPKAAAKLRRAREAPSAIADLDVDQRRAFEEWKGEKERNLAAWEHPTKEELELEFLQTLKGKSKTGSKEIKSDGCGDGTPCGDRKPKIDVETLADKVFLRLIFEARIERERTGWAG